MSERNSKGKYQEEPFNQNLKDAQRSWDESFSKTPSKNSSDDFSYSGITPPQDAFPGVSPDPPQKPEVTNAPPETQTRSTETPIIKPDSGYEPDRSRYQIESNQLEMDAHPPDAETPTRHLGLRLGERSCAHSGLPSFERGHP